MSTHTTLICSPCFFLLFSFHLKFFTAHTGLSHPSSFGFTLPVSALLTFFDRLSSFLHFNFFTHDSVFITAGVLACGRGLLLMTQPIKMIKTNMVTWHLHQTCIYMLVQNKGKSRPTLNKRGNTTINAMCKSLNSRGRLRGDCPLLYRLRIALFSWMNKKMKIKNTNTQSACSHAHLNRYPIQMHKVLFGVRQGCTRVYRTMTMYICLDMMRRANNKTSLCDELGWDRVAILWQLLI